MYFLNREELRRLFNVAHARNKTHHQAMLCAFFSGLRVTEVISLTDENICDGKLSVRRLKRSRPTIHELKISPDPLFDQSPLIEMAKSPGRVFTFSSQRADQFMKKYGALAGLHPSQRRFHVFKHSICMLLWHETHDLNVIQDHVGHRSASSSLIYLRQESAQKAQAILQEINI
jgi:integrase